MRFIDDKGRIGGKVNIIDLFIVVLVLAVVGRVAYARLSPAGWREVEQKFQPINVTIVVAAARDATVNAIQVGDNVVDTKTNLPLGKIIAKRVEPAQVVKELTDGTVIESTSTIRKDIWVTIQGRGRVSPNNIYLGDREIKIGTTVYFKSALYGVYGMVMGIEPVGTKTWPQP